VKILNLFGLGDTALLFTEHMNALGHDAHLLLSNRQFATQYPNWMRNYEHIRGKIHVWDCADLMDPDTLLSLGRYINGFDMVLVHSPGQVYCDLLKRPFCIWDGGNAREYWHPHKHYEIGVEGARRAYHHARWTFLNDIDTLYRFGHNFPHRSFMPLPVDLDTFHPVDTTEHTPEIEGFVVYFASRQVEEGKHIEAVLRGVAMFTQQVNDVILWIANYGNDLPITKMWVKDLGLEPITHYVPLVSKQRFNELLNMADVVIDQLAVGGCGGVTWQALASGVPVIVNAWSPWYREGYGETPPVGNARNAEQVAQWLEHYYYHRERQQKRIDFVRRHHDAREVTERVLVQLDRAATGDLTDPQLVHCHA